MNIFNSCFKDLALVLKDCQFGKIGFLRKWKSILNIWKQFGKKQSDELDVIKNGVKFIRFAAHIFWLKLCKTHKSRKFISIKHSWHTYEEQSFTNNFFRKTGEHDTIFMVSCSYKHRLTEFNRIQQIFIMSKTNFVSLAKNDMVFFLIIG